MTQEIDYINSPTEKHRRSIPVGPQEFSTIIQTKRIYVDKTSYITRWLLEGIGNTNLLHRPRRFGKTLTLSVIKELYSHNTILFKDTEVKEDFWEAIEPHPVISLTFAVSAGKSPEKALDRTVRVAVRKQMRDYGLFEKKDLELSGVEYFIEAIDRLNDKYPDHSPVILIDEYDSLLTYAYQKGSSLQDAADVLSEYLQPLKYQSTSIYAAYITGIMKSQGLQLMSAVNNPSDRSFAPEYAQMIGFTMEEIQRYFTPELEKISGILKLSMEDVLHQIKINYNGYSFSDQCLDKTVYAGYSLCTFMSEASGFRDYWYSTGGINILYSRAKDQIGKIKTLIDLGQIHGSLRELKGGQTTVNENDIELVTLLFYHGYLTFKDQAQGDLCTFHFPNDEVKKSFSRNYAQYFFKITHPTLKKDLEDLEGYIEKCEIDKLMVFFSQLISVVPGTMHTYAENYYHTIVLTLLYIIYGSAARAEQPVAGGIPDLVLDLPELVYIFEFKYVAQHSTDAPLLTELQNAATQVLSKEYFRPYSKKKRLFSIAMVISGEKNNLAGYQIIHELINGVPKIDSTEAKAVLLPWQKKEKKLKPSVSKKSKHQEVSQLHENETIEIEIPPKKHKNSHPSLVESQEKEILVLENKVLLAEAEARVQKAEAQALAQKAEAEARAEKAEAQAQALAQKAEAEAEARVQKAEAEARADKMKLIWRLRSAGNSSQTICELMGMSPIEWEELTGEDLNKK